MVSPAYGQISGAVPPSASKRLVKGAAGGLAGTDDLESAWEPGHCGRTRGRILTLQELALLQQCAWKLPHALAANRLQYAPKIPFAAGLSRSLAWFDFATGR